MADDARPSDGGKGWAALAVGIVGLGVLSVLTTLPVRSLVLRMDPLTGSLYTERAAFGVETGADKRPSAFERRAVEAGVEWEAQPTFFSEYGMSIFGSSLYRGCGRAPAIYGYVGILEAWSAGASDEEVREVVQALRGQSEEERSETLGRLADAWFERSG